MRGVERGKGASGKYDVFMRSDGATCGYCGSLATRHSKKDARSSSDSVLRHQENGTFGCGNKWQCRSREVSTCKNILESPTIKRVLFRGMGIFQSWNNLKASNVRNQSCIWSIGECRVKSEMANYVNFARRMRLLAPTSNLTTIFRL